ncbi:MAG: hypothetical protein IJI65_03370 [Lachnospiraceae bacterium]|nr:hypothetical protein [Lachnospiraceae bacterium]MBQ6258078.1 hypothetical protein [Lachnospiraceae bacterium]
MAARDRTEEVLRKIHLLFQKSVPYNNSKRSVIIDKNDMMDLLKQLNDCIYDLLDEYEMTSASRDKAERRQQKQAESMAFDARRKADDIYAASVLYADRSLQEVEAELSATSDGYTAVYEDFMARIKEQKEEIKKNRLDLKSSLQDLIDTQKYMNLIEDENLRLAKEKERLESGKKGSSKGKSKEQAKDKEKEKDFSAIKPEIKVNEEYFRAQGLDVETGEPVSDTKEDLPQDEADKIADETIAAVSADLDEEYFKWKDEGKDGSDDKEKSGKKKGFGLFGKKS